MTMSTEEERSIAVGDRLIVGKHAATIRYLGSVEGQDGDWAGLEWDDLTRGKHDGSHGGKRYFSCEHHRPTSGSFVRRSKLLATADFGCTLETAIQARYKRSNDGVATEEIHEEAYVPTTSHRRVPIRLVGAAAAAEAVCEDGALLQASFVAMRISSLRPTLNTTSFLSNVQALDLSNNLISRWTAVAALAALLPSLHTLNLSGNHHLLIDSDIDMDLTNESCSSSSASTETITLPSLRTLILNNCGVTWTQATLLSSTALPNLQALYLCRNNISSLVPLHSLPNSSSSFNLQTSLQVLDLEGNRIASWEEVAAALKHLPCLHTLLLNGNELRDVCYPGTGFVALERLMLGHNRLDNWSVADELDRFPALKDVRLSGNPLTSLSSSTTTNSENGGGMGVRYETVARISKLTMLNGGDVSAAERWDAELAYLRRLTDELAAAKAKDDSSDGDQSSSGILLLKAHPKFAALSAKYGELTASGPVSTKGTTLASSMVELVFVAGEKQKIKKVPATLTIGRLKPLVERLLRVKLAHQTLLLRDPTGTVVEDVTQQDGKELRFYEIEDGWHVEVGKRDSAAVAAAKNAAVVEQERRMEEHERGLQLLRAEEERLMVGGGVLREEKVAMVVTAIIKFGFQTSAILPLQIHRAQGRRLTMANAHASLPDPVNFSDPSSTAFNIAIMGDLHMNNNPEDWTLFHEARDQLREIAREGSDAARLVQLGDLGSYDATWPGSTPCFANAKAFLQGFELPVGMVLGNHDIESDEFDTDEANLAAWHSAFGQRHYWTADLGPATFIGLSTTKFRSNPFSVHEVHIDDEQLQFLEKTLEKAATANRPVVMFSHAPILGSGLKALQAVHVKNRCAWLNHSSDPKRFSRLVAQYPNIKLWFSGHFHLSQSYPDSISIVGGTSYILTGVIGEHSSRDGLRHSRLLKGTAEHFEVHTVDHDAGTTRLDLRGKWNDAGPPECLVPPDDFLCDPSSGWLCSEVDCSIDAHLRAPDVKWFNAGAATMLSLQDEVLVEYDLETMAPIGVVFLKVPGECVIRLVDGEGVEVDAVNSNGAAAVAVEVVDTEVDAVIMRADRNGEGCFYQIFQPNKWVLTREKEARDAARAKEQQQAATMAAAAAV